MTRKSTRLFSRNESSAINSELSAYNLRKHRSRKTKVISDSSDDEYQPKELLTPKKSKSHCDDAVTPPKLKKTDGSFTPKHNNTGATNCNTPSQLLDRLSLISPLRNTECHSRKSLFQGKTLVNKDKNGSNPSNCNAEEGNLNEIDKPEIFDSFRVARKALHSSLPNSLPGREEEISELNMFIKGCLDSNISSSMYVSGPPGTGKTASLNMILNDQEISCKIQQVYVNCTAIKSPTAIYSKIAKELGIKVSSKSEKSYLSGIETYLKKSKKMILIVLDEIDQLESKTQSILYTIFEWPSKTDFKLILIGIANALDLTDRVLPRLQAKCELKPKLMHFSPYTKNQIVEIFRIRLQEVGALEVFSPVALQMLAGKVAAVSGDVRRALDIGRRVVELIDNNKGDASLKSIENMTKDCLEEKEIKGTKKVDLKEVLNVLNNVYGTTQNLSEDKEDSFPLQQKIIICSLLLLMKKAKNKDVTVGKLHEVYKKICCKRNILAMDQSEFVGVCTLIETRGIIRISGKKEPRLNRVYLEWDEEEVASTLKDKEMMSMILQDDSCIGKY